MLFCADFRRLNAVIVPDMYPLSRMDDCIGSVYKAKIFTMLDALWGFWKVPALEEDHDKATVTSPIRTLRYKRMLFGLRNAPSTFHRALDVDFSNVRCRMFLVYIDDIITFSNDREDHLDHRHVPALLKEAAIHLKLKNAFLQE